MVLNDERDLRIGIAVVGAILLLVYSVLIAQNLLLWIGPVVTFGLLYLLWRVVRAR